MLRVITVNASNYLGRGVEYTNILFDMVRRNLPEGFEGTFTVFTDTEGDYEEGILVRPLPYLGLEGWWNKLSLFIPGLFDDGDRIVYIDLSTLITGRLDDIVSYDGSFAILRDFYRPDGLQSSFMAWKANTYQELWSDWLAFGMPKTNGGDQAWIEQRLIGYHLWQNLYPDKFISYKVSDGATPHKAVVVKFHGNPKPHEIKEGWVPRVWIVGGMTRVELDNVCNLEIAALNANILSASKRDLPWFDFDYKKHKGQAVIVGGGPSLKNHLNDLRWRKEQGHTIFSTNGTHDYLIENGIIPDYQVLLDARKENVKFVQRPVAGVKYLVASQCDQSIFDALNGYDVTVFHNSTPGAEILLKGYDKPTHLIGGGTTVVIKSMVIAELMGYQTIHLYGVDSCYMDGEHHSYPQTQNDNERVVDVLYEDRMFKCAGWMAQQGQDFIEFAQRFLGTITVAGNGLLAYIACCGVPECAADTRAREILSRLPEGSKGVELGVFTGDLSARLLMREDITLYMVDSWKEHGKGDYAESGDFHASLSQQQQDGYRLDATNATEFAGNRRNIMCMDTADGAKYFDDGSLDFVFIDADHSYKGCRADIEAWHPKVRKGGWLCGHDYRNVDYPCFGVEQAVDEFVASTGLKLQLGDNFTWFTQITLEK